MTATVSETRVLALLRRGRRRLERAGLPGAGRDAEWLLASLLGTDRFALHVEPDREVAAAEAARYRALIERRAGREPLQHLLGFEEFHGLRLSVTPDVLIPRPETEGLVDWAIELLRADPGALVADIGTGSGAIACALTAALPGVQVVAVERSLRSLAVAARNGRALGVAPRVRLVAGDLCAPLRSAGGRLAMVVSNPPYLPSGIIARLEPEVARFEPRLALDGGADGMAVSRRLVADARRALRPGGWLLLEMGDGQAGPLRTAMAAHGFECVETRRDLAGRERYIGGRLGVSGAPARGRTG